MGWVWFAVDAVQTLITWASCLLVLASAALCPFLTATVIVELRNLRQVVDQLEARPPCRCQRLSIFREMEGVEND
jgi:hypothetical protein